MAYTPYTDGSGKSIGGGSRTDGVGANIINPGSVYQTYNPNTGQTSNTSPSAGYYSGVGASVATPNVSGNTGIPQVATATGSFVPLTEKTAYSQPADYSEPAKPGITPEALKQITSINVPTSASKTIETTGASSFLGDSISKKIAPLPFDVNKLNTNALGEQGVNALFKQYYGRNADVKEMEYWKNKSDKQLRPALYPNSEVQLAKNKINVTPKTVVVDTVAKGNTTIKSVDDYLKEIEKLETPEQKKAEDLNTLMQDLIGKTAGKAKTLNDELAKSGGYNETRQELTNAKNNLTSLVAQREALRVDQQGKPVTMNSIIGAEAQIGAVYDSKILTQTALVNSLINNVNQAKEDATAAVDAKYAPQLEALAIAEAQLNALTPILNKQEKDQANALAQYYADQKQAIADQKAIDAQDLDLQINGYKYVNTPAERDKLKAQGYDIVTYNGKTYAKNIGATTKNTFTKVGVDENGNDIMGFVNADEKTVTPYNQSSAINATYTDGSGNVNNIAGWAANDASKVASMQSTANKIGKVTEENIEEKVKQFTPGVTADMIKQASEKYGVSWESIMTQIAQESLGGTSNVAVKNNNFAGLTASSTNMDYYGSNFNGSVGTSRPSNEGGNYIKFATKQDGVNALADLQATYNSRISPDTKTDDEISSYVQQVATGKLKSVEALEKITKSKKDELIKELAKTPVAGDTATDLVAKEKIKLAEDLKTHEGLNSAVGTSFLTRGNKLNWYDKLTGATQDFIAGVERLSSGLSLESLIEAKSRGATFGALSDSEMKILSSAASKLGTWKIKDKDGNTVGYNASEKTFKDELDNINKILNRSVKSSIVNQDTSINDPIGVNANIANSTNPLGL